MIHHDLLQNRSYVTLSQIIVKMYGCVDLDVIVGLGLWISITISL